MTPHHHFCTLFDSNYLTRGLVMYHSLVATGEVFTLYVVCFDTLALEILKQMQLPHLVPISLEEFETPALKTVKPQRSTAEYCWTCTPHVIRHVLDRYQLPEATYLDADLYFHAKPSILLEELAVSGASVLITEHRYTPAKNYLDSARNGMYRNPIKYGIYCVQFITFKADSRGREVLQWWQDRCLEWCFGRLEDGKFGDQKYLDDWPTRFRGVHVLQHPGGGVAPWNIMRYSLGPDALKPRIDGHDMVFYHFHNLRMYDSGYCDLGYYRLTARIVDLLYRPYARALHEAEDDVRRLAPGFNKGYLRSRNGIADWAIYVLRKITGTYNVYKAL